MILKVHILPSKYFEASLKQTELLLLKSIQERLNEFNKFKSILLQMLEAVIHFSVH